MPHFNGRQLGPRDNFSELTPEEIFEQGEGRLFYDEELGVKPQIFALDCFFFEPEQYRNVHGRAMRFTGREMNGVLVGETTSDRFKFALVVWLDTGYEPTVDYVHERDIS